MKKKIKIPDKCDECQFRIGLDSPRAFIGYYCTLYNSELTTAVVHKKKKPNWCVTEEIEIEVKG